MSASRAAGPRPTAGNLGNLGNRTALPIVRVRPAAIWAGGPAVEDEHMRRPPLPRFRSPLRGPWLTSVFATVLLVGLPLVSS